MAKQKPTDLSQNGDNTDVVHVSPAVIAWALTRSKLPRDFVAKKLSIDVSELDAWAMAGGPHPPFAKARLLAKTLRVPFGFLYLDKPPQVDLPLPDFRGFDHQYKPSSDLLELLNDIFVKRDWFRDHEIDSGSSQLKFVGSFETSDAIESVAADIRNRLGINTLLRESATTWSDYLNILSKRAENAGVLVMRSSVVANLSHRKLQTRELLGFAVADKIAPIVFINSGDYKASQVFTFAHEIAHIWIGESAIANPDELEAGRNRIESFCNRVAAEVLVPKQEFLNAWKGISSSADIRVSRLARRFWVSGYVALRRARELGEVSQDQYEAIKASEGARRKKDKGGGGDYYRNILTRMSHKFTETVLSDVNRGKIELRDAASLLGMKVPTLVRFAEKSK